ncbi:spore cortex biosynthesis protein YabQ [[Clostridium] innocuum]|nr:spore cortex biosynthesis protein YabQ [[Clostridium] innocuum]
MLLPTQIQAILYHFLMGWVYAFGFSFLISFVKYLRFPILKGIVEILYHILFTSLMFIGLYKINGGITNIYLICFFILGAFIYFTWYLSVFLQLFTAIRRLLHPFKVKLLVAKSKIIAIIRLPGKIRKRRKANAKRKKSSRKKRKRKKHPMKILISLLAIGVSCYLIYAASTDVIVMLNLKQEISANNSEINKLSSQKKELSAQKEKLKDPEYVKRYARGKFLVIKKGEQVFKLPGGSSEDTNGE